MMDGGDNVCEARRIRPLESVSTSGRVSQERLSLAGIRRQQDGTPGVVGIVAPIGLVSGTATISFESRDVE